MDALAVRAARDLIEGLTSDLVWYLDHGPALRALDLFCHELEFGVAGRLLDRNALSADLARRATTRSVAARHILSGFRVLLSSDDAVQAQTTVLIYGLTVGEGGPQSTVLAGDWHIRAEREGSEWRLRSVIVHPLAVQPT